MSGQWQPGQSGNPAGKPPGTKAKFTLKVCEMFLQAAEEIGGVERLVVWIKEDPLNERVFWSQIATKLLPLQLTGKDGGPVETVSEIQIRAVDPE